MARFLQVGRLAFHTNYDGIVTRTRHHETPCTAEEEPRTALGTASTDSDVLE